MDTPGDVAMWVGAGLMLTFPLAGLHWLGYRRWSRARGKVVRNEAKSRGGSEGRLYAAVVRFTTGDGREVEFEDSLQSNRAYRKGEKVDVIYPPATPEYARIGKNVYTLHFVIGTVGALIFAVGLVTTLWEA
jgi:hypothetical protein